MAISKNDSQFANFYIKKIAQNPKFASLTSLNQTANLCNGSIKGWDYFPLIFSYPPR